MEFEQTLEGLRAELARCVRAASKDDIPWSWVAVTVSQILGDHSSGVSRAVVMTELEAKWQQTSLSAEADDTEVQRTLGAFFHRGTTAQAVETLRELRIAAMEKLAKTTIWMWRLAGLEGETAGGRARAKHMDAFVHPRFYAMIESAEFEGFFGGGRRLYTTGLRATACEEEGGAVVLRLLPTASAVFELRATTDAGLLRAFFGVEIDGGGRAVQSATAAFEAGQVWGTVESVAASQDKLRGDAVVELAVLEPGNVEARVVAVEFRGSDGPVARALHRGDHLGLVCAEAQGDAGFVYGAQTLAFVLAGRRTAQAGRVTQVDMRQHTARATVSQLRADMVGVTVLARVAAVSANMPAEGEARRRALRVSDATATCDATVWGALAERAARLRVGQMVLLQSFDTHTEHGAVMLNGSTDIHSDIVVVSSLPALPPSARLRQCVALADVCAPATRYVRASITAVVPGGAGLRDSRDAATATKLVHAVCGRRVARTGPGTLTCAKCARAVSESDTESVFALAVDLDDGTAVRRARVAATVAPTLLCLTPERFLSLGSHAAQLAALAKPLGLELVACLAAFFMPAAVASGDCRPGDAELLRIDAACPAADVGVVD